jgi:hypothetical protein
MLGESVVREAEVDNEEMCDDPTPHLLLGESKG